MFVALGQLLVGPLFGQMIEMVRVQRVDKSIVEQLDVLLFGQLIGQFLAELVDLVDGLLVALLDGQLRWPLVGKRIDISIFEQHDEPRVWQREDLRIDLVVGQLIELLDGQLFVPNGPLVDYLVGQLIELLDRQLVDQLDGPFLEWLEMQLIELVAEQRLELAAGHLVETSICYLLDELIVGQLVGKFFLVPVDYLDRLLLGH